MIRFLPVIALLCLPVVCRQARPPETMKSVQIEGITFKQVVLKELRSGTMLSSPKQGHIEKQIKRDLRGTVLSLSGLSPLSIECQEGVGDLAVELIVEHPRDASSELLLKGLLELYGLRSTPKQKVVPMIRMLPSDGPLGSRAHAEERSSHISMSSGRRLEVQNASLENAVKSLERPFGKLIYCAPEIADERVSFKMKWKTEEEALQRLAALLNVRCEPSDSLLTVTYIYRPEPE